MLSAPDDDDRAATHPASALPFAGVVLVCLVAALLIAGCGGSSDGDGPADAGGGSGVLIEETGSIESADIQDPDHAGLRFDAYPSMPGSATPSW
ncbi:MAG: hypothetical protein FJ000_05170 [Actinobacteria bacterium]|nr:hypothetical protein [Actinomycetota bacterium]